MPTPDNPRDEADQFLEDYGVRRPPRYLPAHAAPPVDEEKLRALARGGLALEDSHEVYALIGMFRSWDDGYRRILDETPGGVPDERSNAENGRP